MYNKNKIYSFTFPFETPITTISHIKASVHPLY